MKEIEILESGLRLSKELDSLFWGFTEEDSYKLEYLVKARFSIIMILRWMEKYVSEFNVTFYNMIPCRKRGEHFMDAIEIADVKDELGETMVRMENLFLDMSTSWSKQLYSGIGDFAVQCMEEAQILAMKENRSEEEAFLDGEIAFTQMFQEGPLKTDANQFYEMLKQIYEIIGDPDSYYSGNVSIWYIQVLENQKLPVVKKALNGKVPLEKKELDIVKELFSDLWVADDPFHISDVMDYFTGQQGYHPKGKKLQYTFIAGSNIGDDICYDEHQYLPHRGFEMYLLDRMILYLEKKYPEFAKSWQDKQMPAAV